MLAIDSETTGLAISKGCRAFTISAACHEHKTYLWKFKVDPFTRNVIYKDDILQDFKDTIAKHEELIFHNANFDIQALDALGVTNLFDNHDIHDTMVMSHAYKADNRHGLKELGVTIISFPEDDEKQLVDISKAAQKEAAKLAWKIATKSLSKLTGTKKEPWKADYWIPEHLATYLNYPKDHIYRTICDKYATNDAIRTLGLYIVFQELMTAKQKIAYHKSRKLIKPVLDMQYEKVTVLPDKLAEAKEKYRTKVNVGIIELQNIVGDRNFNPASPIQLRKVLFDKYKFPIRKLSLKSGEASTDKDAITNLLKDCPTTGVMPEKFKFLVKLKGVKKAKTTIQYINNYDEAKDKYNRIQPFFKQTGTGTGRFSCENPNLTNVGKADMSNPFSAKDIKLDIEGEEESFKLRNVFGPTNGNIWTCIDYKQFQLLIFAVVSENKELIDAYIQGVDLHEATARQIFNTLKISAEQRTMAKNVNFGILFGAGPAKIDQTAGVPGLYSLFLSRLPGAKRYLETQTRLVRKKGYVHTLGGYRLYVPRDRGYAASCYIIQGTEAEIVKSAMVDVNGYTYAKNQDFTKQYNYTNRLHKQLLPLKRCPYKMILMVHDELVFRSDKTYDKHLINLMRIMENAGARIGVPVQVDADIVKNNWASKEEYIPAI